MKKTGRMLVSVGTILVLMGGLVIAAEELGQELITNGDMEKGSPPVNWRPSSSTLSADADRHSGKQSLRITGTAKMGHANQYFQIKPGAKYRLDFRYKCSRPGGLYVRIRVPGEKKNSYGEIGGNSKWTRLIGYFTAPEKEGATKALVAFHSSGDKYILIDDVSIKEVLESEEDGTSWL